ncbi:hypothetical protein COC60_15765 [Bacillus thuringiensis]|uniref:Uncharacterized protein n=2 Tax=Bacillus cereus group TaxID=86661 RepID=A0A9X6TIA2_BACTU|nr:MULTISPECIES: hypothetical protein [Bacillus]AXR17230.1 hypothetical protein DOS87_14525 [Bacillus sp. CR71]AXR22952.1 hypothetical protein DPQ26_14475 [Bacillus sp. E25]EJR06534.1 hypothetical protein II5_02357 [Bacillus cereus MSX-A1]KAA6455512.1 hypothetical protein DX932_26575 [Bacillus cereus]KAB2421165.1 hypothetical protein F8167_19675 [Bacillus cereus]
MNQIDFISIQSPVNQLAIQAAIMFLAIGVTFGLIYILLLKIHAPRWLASVLATTCTIVAIYQTLLILFP